MQKRGPEELQPWLRLVCDRSVLLSCLKQQLHRLRVGLSRSRPTFRNGPSVDPAWPHLLPSVETDPPARDASA